MFMANKKSKFKIKEISKYLTATSVAVLIGFILGVFVEKVSVADDYSDVKYRAAVISKENVLDWGKIDYDQSLKNYYETQMRGAGFIAEKFGEKFILLSYIEFPNETKTDHGYLFIHHSDLYKGKDGKIVQCDYKQTWGYGDYSYYDIKDGKQGKCDWEFLDKKIKRDITLTNEGSKEMNGVIKRVTFEDGTQLQTYLKHIPGYPARNGNPNTSLFLIQFIYRGYKADGTKDYPQICNTYMRRDGTVQDSHYCVRNVNAFGEQMSDEEAFNVKSVQD